jgi:hypothetical protein
MRICFFGAANSGKSTTAAYIYSELSSRGLSAALVPEYVKERAFAQVFIQGVDQLEIFGKQIWLEDLPISAGIDYVVCECPVLLGTFYAKKFGCWFWKNLYEMATEWEKQNASINVFLVGAGLEYDCRGRYGNKEISRKFEDELLAFLEEHYKENSNPLVRFQSKDREEILKFVLRKIEEENVR